MQDVFRLRNDLIEEYSQFSRSFTRIAADDIRAKVDAEYEAGRYWPEPLIQINPNYQRKDTVQNLATGGTLHPACAELFKAGKPEGRPVDMHLFVHQIEAIALAQQRKSYVVTTGTGSGKSLSFFVPIIDRILKAKDCSLEPRTRAIVIYPMNALANSQLEELNKFLHGYPEGKAPITVGRYTGQEDADERNRLSTNPPDILLTNFMMLELILTRYEEKDRKVVENCKGLEFLVLDELHTYRGRQGSDVAMLVRRLRQRLSANDLVCIGTSATMSSAGTAEDKRRVVAEVAGRLFGTSISAGEIIGETLERVTDPKLNLTSILPHLRKAVIREEFRWQDFESFKSDPLAIWVELTLGIEFPKLEKPRRAKPITLTEAAKRLSEDAEVPYADAKRALSRFLMAAHAVVTPQGRAPFAFKLHQFISGPGKVMTTLEPEKVRHITLDAQVFAPGRQSAGVRLYSTHFCRDCGQEYHPVTLDSTTGAFEPRNIDEVGFDQDDEEGTKKPKAGFLASVRPGQVYTGELEDLPEHWLDFTAALPKVKQNYREAQPIPTKVSAAGTPGSGTDFWFIPGKFRFCLGCGQQHEAQGRDINRLSSLSGEGRASATTVITLSLLRLLFKEQPPGGGLPDPRKLLGFTDNRQDAALQSGHFNDLIFLLILRSGLLRALALSGGSLKAEKVAGAVFNALGFDRSDEGVLAEYLKNPKLKGLGLNEARRALHFILGYRLMRDLRKGWRLNNPNLDQLRLVSFDFTDLDTFCADESSFPSKSGILARLGPEGRKALASYVFDEMRRALCLNSPYLAYDEQQAVRKGAAYNYLNERWQLPTDENLATSRWLVLGKVPEIKGRKRADLVSGGLQSRLIRNLARHALWKNAGLDEFIKGWKQDNFIEVLGEFFKAAMSYGYLQLTQVEDNLPGWQLSSAALEWRLDPGQLPAGEAAKTNRFFRSLYQNLAELLENPEHPLFDFEAHEHTAQVDSEIRQALESRFRFTKKDREDWKQTHGETNELQRLPVLYCSPTMELGVDISSLNTVYLRNVPPTPANYAQRSGRAGRSGQPALVVTYCASQSPHDQWFFNHATEMVHGVVKPPTLDLANFELVKSHLQSVWIAAIRCALEPSIMPLLAPEKPGLPMQQGLRQTLEAPAARERALEAARSVVTDLGDELAQARWFDASFVERVIAGAPAAFDAALDRWRSLYLATQRQMAMADELVRSHATPQRERENAGRRYAEALRQMTALTKSDNRSNTDFYTYRYLAGQGFLPGYNFPRLPLMAWIPGKKGSGTDENGMMISRPRFLALSEFGPLSLIYHQGGTYRVTGAKLNVSAGEHITSGSKLGTLSARICSNCGYGHLDEKTGAESSANVCESCCEPLSDTSRVNELYHVETVETTPAERISINDEERQRSGFELQTTYRIQRDAVGNSISQQSMVMLEGKPVATLTYAPTAEIWRINRGWRRRKEKNRLGFYINPLTGRWSKEGAPSEAAGEKTGEDEQPGKIPPQLIVPFVKDHRNILILRPSEEFSKDAMITLQAALKRGIEQTFQIEEAELVAEPLPTQDDRKAILFYEAAEGGAGILRRLAEEKESLAEVARTSLSLMHYRRPDDGQWNSAQLDEYERGDCEAGCHRCLLSYYNQPDHKYINRRDPAALRLLVALANAGVIPSEPSSPSPQNLSPLAETGGAASSDWLTELTRLGLRRPDATSVPINGGTAVADGLYKASRAVVFLSDPEPETRSHIENRGNRVIVLGHPSEWLTVFAAHDDVFGKSSL